MKELDKDKTSYLEGFGYIIVLVEERSDNNVLNFWFVFSVQLCIHLQR